MVYKQENCTPPINRVKFMLCRIKAAALVGLSLRELAGYAPIATASRVQYPPSCRWASSRALGASGSLP